MIGAIVGGDVPADERRDRAAEVLGIPVTLVDAALGVLRRFHSRDRRSVGRAGASGRRDGSGLASPAGLARTVRLLLDEMHSPTVAETLRAEGHDVVAVAAVPGLRSVADEDLLGYAAAEGFVVVTENVVDFAAIAARWVTEDRAHAGLVFTSPKRFNRATRAYPGNLVVALRALLTERPDVGSSVTWWL